SDGPDTYFCTIPGHRAAGMEGKFELLEEGGPEVAAVVPTHDGEPVNVDFEDGTLEGWRAEGDAFAGSAVRSADNAQGVTGFEGSRWVSSGDTITYLARGTLVSEPFTVTEPFVSFRTAGGALKDTRVEIVRAEDDSVLFEISGYGGSTLRPVVVDLSPHVGEDVYVRLIDREHGMSGIPYIKDNKLAYIAFDALRLHPTRPQFPNELDPSEIRILPPLDYIPEGRYSGEDAVAAMDVPEGFKVPRGAAEPDVVRPIAFTLDDRGRLWVVEAMTYPV